MENLFRRWKTLQLVEPIYTLTSRGAPRAGIDQDRYDLKSLALAAIDFVVAKQASFDDHSATINRLDDHVRELARAMYPDDPQRDWVRAASAVLDMLLNDGQAHRFEWRPPNGGDPQPWRFRLLRMVDSGNGTTVAATDEAIMLYLQALDVDLADREMATKLMLSRQMEAREFDRARRSAVEARRYAEGVATQLRERLDDTRRDIRSVDWDTDMPERLAEAHAKVTEQIDLDAHIIALAQAGVDADDPDAAVACRAVLTEIHRSQDVHLRLEREIQRAVPVYLDAQERQRLRPRGLAALVDLSADLLEPLVAADASSALACGNDLARAGAGVRIPAQFCIDDVLNLALRPLTERELTERVLEVPEDLVDADDDNIPDGVAVAAADILATATRDRPARLSDLLAAARTADATCCDDAAGGDEQDDHGTRARRDRPGVADIVWAAGLWAWLSTTGTPTADEDDDTLPRNTALAGVLAGLVALDDGARLDPACGYDGADLVVARAHHLTDPNAPVTDDDPDDVDGTAPVLQESHR